ncbi:MULTISPECIES: DUF262 domain-containing protein [Clostridium]|uniref:DUF262 domain-containing protein n=1 Tax=Clostridium TaxID=1485 RepID=UPI0019D28C36|nr:DUF262 domain-containing protein [Clostridium sp. 2-1]MBN7576281.1 DUF262 domain-containing protein [Clostridium beijerinckii]MBN7579715.1 DUF262 domain-containing protein [Clostridium beijerinckii]MBN7585354.1 DUF262 domain-containing protein [Clostridium beijerinckii]MBO0520803.1 DUF262 domain-containing protein [Clostridium beijerinckii]
MEDNNLELISALDTQAKNVKTKSLDISFNELLDMYNNKELIIDPEYQRMFRWSEEKESMFIESLILEMPLPPVFVIEIEDGVYELIDGLQRISTYLHFRYEDMDTELQKEFCKDRITSALELIGCDIVKELNGYTFSKLPRAIQLKLKRNFIRVEVLRKENNSDIRYHMFKRLNTGGELLSPQEVRNCTIRLLGTEFNDFIISCSNNKDFRTSIENLREEDINTKKDEELILRFFAFKNNLENYKKDLDFFLTDYMEKVTTKELVFEYDKEQKDFEQTFKFIAEMFGKNAFSSCINLSENKYKSDIIMYLYDSISCGVANCVELLVPEKMGSIKQSLNNLKQSTEFLRTRTGGKRNTEERIAMVIKTIRES